MSLYVNKSFLSFSYKKKFRGSPRYYLPNTNGELYFIFKICNNKIINTKLIYFFIKIHQQNKLYNHDFFVEKEYNKY